jgi:PilZ domain-containing protein
MTEAMAHTLGLLVELFRAEEQFQGQCIELEPEERELLATVEFSAERAPGIHLGENTHLAFHGTGLVSKIEADALMVLRTDDQTRRCYSFRMAEVPKRMLLLLGNRRQSSRQHPASSQPVRVLILDLPRGMPSELAVHDVSSTGLCVVVDSKLDRHLVNDVRLPVCIQLPHDGSVNVTATIRHRRIEGSTILYGLEFDDQLDSFGQAQRQLLAFLARLRSDTAPRPR